MRHAKARVRGRGRGGNFFAISREVWEELWAVETTNRLNLVTAYLVLLAGTGSDHRLTKWSAKACEEHAGLGKPRAKHAIEELIRNGLIQRTESSTRLSPQYQLPALPLTEDPIFLPVQLVTGLERETPILRRVREVGDPMLLRMLLDLYGLIQLDATHGIPLNCLRQTAPAAEGSRKVFEVGVHAVWALCLGNTQSAGGDWTEIHRTKAKDTTEVWRIFWERVSTLKKIGAIWFEPWVFDGEELDAEPLMPVDLSVFYRADPGDEIAELTRRVHAAASDLAGDRQYLLDRHPADLLLPLATHHRAPALRGVVRLRVEADTPGRRLSYARRQSLVDAALIGFDRLRSEAAAGQYDRPMRIVSRQGRQ